MIYRNPPDSADSSPLRATIRALSQLASNSLDWKADLLLSDIELVADKLDMDRSSECCQESCEFSTLKYYS
jgi:hypothetical protein